MKKTGNRIEEHPIRPGSECPLPARTPLGHSEPASVDPPYGIEFNSNFQWSTTTRDVRDGRADNITREPEQVRAFRDTWHDGIHAYLTTCATG